LPVKGFYPGMTDTYPGTLTRECFEDVMVNPVPDEYAIGGPTIR
jgi:hypothetical protein